MGSTQTLTFTITNSSSGGNICERIYEMRFRLPGTGTVFSSATAPRQLDTHRFQCHLSDVPREFVEQCH